ncbi:MAG: hypothetical protein U9N49_00135 [Campylobacterota bacterium]|nr:hypothetical protein [Campylobacterota bacterium]
MVAILKELSVLRLLLMFLMNTFLAILFSYILYLVLNKLLDIPILYISRYIIKNKADYYRLLQEVRTDDNWEEWVLYILDGVEQTSLETIELIYEIDRLMIKTKCT